MNGETPTNNENLDYSEPSGMESLAQEKSFEEHMQELQSNQQAHLTEERANAPQSPEARNSLREEELETDAYEVLYSFVGNDEVNEKDLFKIATSRPLRVLIDAGISLKDAMAAGILYDEHYYKDGYQYDKPQDSADYVEDILDSIPALAEFFAPNVPSEKQDLMREIIANRAQGNDELSAAQRNFLREDPNEVALRILYGNKDLSEERTNDILTGLDRYYGVFLDNVHSVGPDASPDLKAVTQHAADEELVRGLGFADKSSHDFHESESMVVLERYYEINNKIREMVNDNFDAVLRDAVINERRGYTEYDNNDTAVKLLLKYGDPVRLMNHWDPENPDDLHPSLQWAGISERQILGCLSGDDILNYPGVALGTGLPQAELLEKINLTPFSNRKITKLIDAGFQKTAILHSMSESMLSDYLDYSVNQAGLDGLENMRELGFDAESYADAMHPRDVIAHFDELVLNEANPTHLLTNMMRFSLVKEPVNPDDGNGDTITTGSGRTFYREDKFLRRRSSGIRTAFENAAVFLNHGVSPYDFVNSALFKSDLEITDLTPTGYRTPGIQNLLMAVSGRIDRNGEVVQASQEEFDNLCNYICDQLDLSAEERANYKIKYAKTVFEHAREMLQNP